MWHSARRSPTGAATEGVFVARAEGLQAIALAGDNAPGVPTGSCASGARWTSREPALNNSGVIALPAAILKGPVLGGIFVARARDLRLPVGAGDRAPDGSMVL